MLHNQNKCQTWCCLFEYCELEFDNYLNVVGKSNDVINFIVQVSTGLTGLKVAKFPHHQLSVVYGKTLRTLAQMPEDVAYRVNTEKIIRERAQIVATVSYLSIGQYCQLNLFFICFPTE